MEKGDAKGPCTGVNVSSCLHPLSPRCPRPQAAAVPALSMFVELVAEPCLPSGLPGKVVTLPPGPLRKQDLQDVLTKHIREPTPVWVVLRRFSSFQWVWWQHAENQLTQASFSAKSASFSNKQCWESKEGLLAGACCAQRRLGSGADPAASLHREELALSSSPVFSGGVLMKQLALLGGLACALLFALLPLPWPPPPPPPTSLFCLCSLSFHSLGWPGLLFAEGKCRAAL